MRPIWQSTSENGKFSISLAAFQLGNDLLLVLTGGKPHIGCVSIASSGTRQDMRIAKHQEHIANNLIINKIKKSRQTVIAIAGGVHFDGLLKHEIAICLDLCEKLGAELAKYLETACKYPGENPMLDQKDLDAFITRMRSGELENEFKSADASKKEEILEMLEKLMDAGELADEVATRIIYRGLPMPVPPQH